jgi:hypothetical protein
LDGRASGRGALLLKALQQPPAEGLPAWMHAGLQWVALEVAQWREQRVEAAPVQQALALLDGDANRRNGNRPCLLPLTPCLWLGTPCRYRLHPDAGH